MDKSRLLFAIERIMDRLCTVVFTASIIAAIILGIYFLLPEGAHAQEMTATNNAELVNALNAGSEKINIEALKIPPNLKNMQITTHIDDAGALPPTVSFSVHYGLRASNNEVVFMQPHYDCAPSQIASRNDRYWSKVNDIASRAQGSAYEKALFVYEQLLSTCEYDWKVPATLNSNKNLYYQRSTPASALLDGWSICTGYARACVDLFRAVGISAHLVHGSAHAWLSCQIDGMTLTCDPTNDDGVQDGARPFFMVKSDGSLYRPIAAPAAPQNPAPLAVGVIGADDPSDVINTPGDAPVEAAGEFADDDVAEDPETSVAQYPKKDLYVSICGGLVPVHKASAKAPLMPANMTIYQSVLEGKYEATVMVPSFKLYAMVNSAEYLNGGALNLA